MSVSGRQVGAIFAVALAMIANATADDDPAAGVFREGFETQTPSWQSEYLDTTINLITHDRSNRALHGGRLSERFQFVADTGGQFFVSLRTPRVLLESDPRIGLWVRSNRAGVRVHARVVLPGDTDPETKAPSFVLVPGTIYTETDHWQLLEASALAPAVERQARVLRASSRRPVPLKGAYIEQVVVNLLGAPGESEVFLDDLEISPVARELLAGHVAANEPASTPEGAPAKPGAALPRVRVEANFIERLSPAGNYIPWFPTAIHAPGANITELRRAGFDVLAEDSTEPARLKSAVDRGFLLAPTVDLGDGDPTEAIRAIETIPERDSIALYRLGEGLGRRRETAVREQQVDRVRAAMRILRDQDEDAPRLATALVDGDLPLFARAPVGLDVVGVSVPGWGGSQAPLEIFQYLIQRKWLTARSNLSAPFMAWIPAAAPPEAVRNIWGEGSRSATARLPVLPEQVRLLTYLALTAGYRGVGYLADADITRPVGRDLLIEMSFLNLEMDLVEEILARNKDQISLYDVFNPDPPVLPTNPTSGVSQRVKPLKELPPRPGMKAAAIPLPNHTGKLILVGDYAEGAQWQPPQMAAHNILITPTLPEGAQAFEISPGDVKVLEPLREVGGRRFKLEDFGVTAMVLCTTDMALYARVRELVDSVRNRAVPLAIEQAELRLASVKEVQARLEADGRTIRSEEDIKQRRKSGIEGRAPDERDLITKAEEYIKSARDSWEQGDFAWAWAEARRASRPLRVLMHGYWIQANAELAKAAVTINPKREKPAPGAPKPPDFPPVLVSAVSCPPLISYYSLPDVYLWTDWIKGRPGYGFGENRVPTGDFNDPHAIIREGWVDVGYRIDGILAKVSPVQADEPDPKQPKNPIDPTNKAIKMEVKAEKPEDLDTILPGYLDFPVAAVRSPPYHALADNLIRISVLIKRPFQSAPGLGGIIVRDSIGGELLQYRTSGPIPGWSRVILFRKAPADGDYTVTLGLAGYGEAYFDDLRVEVIEEKPRAGNGSIARGRPRERLDSPENPDPSLPAPASARASTRRLER